MRKPTYLEMRGAEIFLAGAYTHVSSHPWETGWAYPEIDKYGNAESVQEALDLLSNARKSVKVSLMEKLNG